MLECSFRIGPGTMDETGPQRAVPISDVLTLLAALDVVVYTADRKGRITWVTGAIRDVIGYAPEEVLGRKVEAFVAPESLVMVSRQMRR